MVNFRWTGYNALILLAAMQAVPREYYEAATVDGANAFRQFWSITLPSLKPTLIFVIITSTIGGLQIFDEPRMFDNTGKGGAAQQWLTITLYLYNIGWGEFNFGRAAALAWILFLIIIVIGLINLLITRRLVRDEGGRGEIQPPPPEGSSAMSAISTPPLAIVEENLPNARERRRNQRTTKIRGVRASTWVYIGLGVVAVSAIFPYYWSFLIGSGTASTINDPNMSWLPGGNFVANALSVINDPAVNFWLALWNSIFSSTVIAASVVVFSTLAGWAFAKLRFRGGKWLLAFVVATMAVPMQLGVVPLYILFADLGWTGNIGAVIVPALTSAFGVFWMTQYLSQTVPDELIEAARVDGASQIRTFWTVGVVAARPAAAMLFLFTFVGAWNQFFWPFIVLDRQSPTLPVALSLLQSNYFVDYSIVLAGVLLATIPLLILFAVAGKQLVSGIMAGAVKG